MTGRRWIALATSVACLLVGLLWQLWPRDTGSDADRISAALEAMTDSARRGRVDEVMAHISRDFRAGTINRRQLRLLLLRSRQNSRPGDYEVRWQRPNILPPDPTKPNQRMVVGRLTVFEAFGGETLWGSDGLLLVMRNEDDRLWGIIPTKRWRVLGVPNLPPLPIGGE